MTSNGGGESDVDGAGPGTRPESRSIAAEMGADQGVGFGRFLRYFLGLGSLGFGGPIATVGYVQRDLVEQRHWMSKEDLVDGIALGQTMPGPLAAQVAMWMTPPPGDEHDPAGHCVSPMHQVGARLSTTKAGRL